MTLDEATIVDLRVTGFTTTNNLRFASGVGTHLELDTLNVGVSTLGVVTATTIRTTGSVAIGDTLFVAGGVVVGGGITFQGDIEVNVDADFAGDVNISGIATIRELEASEATIGILGVTTSLAVGAALTGTQVLDVKGTAGFGTDVVIDERLTVLGSSDFTTVLADDLTVTNSTILDSLTVNSAAALNGGLDVLNGAVVNELEVSGVSTFIGIATFKDHVYVDGNLVVAGDINVDDIVQDQITGNNLNLNVGGIGTIPILDYVQANGGILTATKLVTPDADFKFIDAEYSNIGVATVGILSASGITINGDIALTKITASSGDIGILTTNTLYSKNADIIVGAASTLEVNELEWTIGIGNSTRIQKLAVSQSTKLSGITTVDSIEILTGTAEEFAVTNVLNVDGRANLSEVGVTTLTANRIDAGIATITVFDNTSSFIGFASIRNTEIGVSTVGLSTVGVLTAQSLNFTSGLGTHLELSTEEVGVSTVGFATITEAYIGVATVGMMTVTQNTLMIGDLTVLGTANVGAGGSGTLIINGGGQITGIVTIGENSITLDGRRGIEQIVIGAGATISGMTTTGERSYIQIKDGLYEQLDVSGITTTNVLDVTTNVSVGGTIGVGSAYIGGETLITGGVGAAGTIFSTFDLTADGDVAVGRSAFVTENAALGSVRVSGASTFTGISTFGNDVFVEGNLNVKGDITVDDIVYDTVSGNQLNISGVGTIGFVSFTTAAGSSLTVTELDVDTLQVGSYDITYGQAQFVKVTGFATHNNYSFNAGIGSVLSVTEQIFAQDIDAPTGIATINRVDAANLDAQSLTADTIFNNLTASLRNVEISESQLYHADTRFTGITTFQNGTDFDIEPAFKSGLNVTNGTVKVTGLTTTGSLVVGTTASVNDLTVRDDALVKGDLTVEGTVSFEGGGGGGGGGGDTVVGIDSITTRF